MAVVTVLANQGIRTEHDYAIKWGKKIRGIHDDVIKWKKNPRYWPFVRGIHRSPVNSPHKGQWRGLLMFSFICTWIDGWVNNGEAGGLRRYRAHYDVIVMWSFVRGIPRLPGGFPSQRPVARSFDVFFNQRLNKRLIKRSRHRWFKPPSRLLWRRCNEQTWCWHSCPDIFVFQHQKFPSSNHNITPCNWVRIGQKLPILAWF